MNTGTNTDNVLEICKNYYQTEKIKRVNKQEDYRQKVFTAKKQLICEKNDTKCNVFYLHHRENEKRKNQKVQKTRVYRII